MLYLARHDLVKPRVRQWSLRIQVGGSPGEGQTVSHLCKDELVVVSSADMHILYVAESATML